MIIITIMLFPHLLMVDWQKLSTFFDQKKIIRECEIIMDGIIVSPFPSILTMIY